VNFICSCVILSLVATILVTASVVVQPLNSTVVFLKEKDVVLSKDAWRVKIDISPGTYAETASTVRADLLVLHKQKTEFTSMSEFKQIEMLLDTLEAKLQTFQQFLPRLDKRRGLVNFCRNVLKIYFVLLWSLMFTSCMNLLTNCGLEIFILFIL
jgi:hypothetical protein